MDNILEEWRPVVGYEGLYEVSDIGRVRSMKKSIVNINGKKCIWKSRIIKQFDNRRGGRVDKKVTLANRKNRKNFFVSRLVAFAFPEICGEWFEGAQVNHKDENPENNAAWNLEWCTAIFNINYGTRNERISKSHLLNKNRINRRTKKIIQCTKNGDYIKKWPSIREAQRAGFKNVWHAIHEKITCGGYKWVYESEYA